MNKSDYKKASAFYLFGSLFNKGIAFFTIPIFTRLLATYDYGVVNTYNAWVSMVSMAIGFALHTGIRVAYIDYKSDFKEYTTTTITFTTAVSAFVTVVVMLVIKVFNIPCNSLLVVLCLFHSYATAIINDYCYYLMMEYRYKIRTLYMVLPNFLSVLVSIAVIIFFIKDNLFLGRIVPTAIITLLFGITAALFTIKGSKTLFKAEFIKYGLKVSAPLIVHGISLSILSQSDRTMITALADASQTGIYGLVYNFGMLATVITSSLEGVWVPWFFQSLRDRKLEDIHKTATNYINLMTYAMGCLILVAPEIVKLLAAPAYWEGISIIPPIVLANYIIFLYTLYVNIEHFYKKTIYITINTLIAAATNIILNYILIPKFGYVAAAYTTVTAYVLSFVLHARYAKKLEPDLYPIKTFLRPTTHLLLITIAFYVLVDKGIIRWIIMIAYFALMLYRERKEVASIFPEVSSKLKKRKQNE